MAKPKQHLLKIHPKLLFAIYLCIPAAALFMVVDTFLLKNRLQTTLSTNPDNYALFTLLFTLPHILSSFFGFIDKQYYQTYRTKLLTGARYAVLGAVLLPFISLKLAFIVFAIFTMFHVFRQQSGIAKALMRGTNTYHNYWEWLGIVLSLGLYIDIYTPYTPPGFAAWVWLAGFIIYTLAGLKAAQAANTDIGRQYFWVTHFIPLASAFFLYLGYPILSIAVPRIIHDLTAYTFYITHDSNRYTEARSNYLYRSFSWLGLPVIVLNPLVSILIALLFQFNLFGGTYMTLTVLFLFHYYTESFIWKKDSLHRRYISYAG